MMRSNIDGLFTRESVTIIGSMGWQSQETENYWQDEAIS